MEELKHECGVAIIRLLKPLKYYEQKYGTWAWGFNKLYLMMEKQHNRGQEGAGLATVSLTTEPGNEYMFREKAEGKDAITEIFSRVRKEMAGELYMGHLRYSTTGKSGLQFVHPFLRRNNWRAKNLCLCGNFNMTNIDEIFRRMIDEGQSPRIYSDTYITLDLMGHRLDREVERNYAEAKAMGLRATDITRYIDDHVDMARVLRTTLEAYDGGYVMCGLTGSGEMFAVRDPWGIRPAFWYRDDEVVAVASERPVLQTSFDLQTEDISELLPGQALIVHKDCKILTPRLTLPSGAGAGAESSAPVVESSAPVVESSAPVVGSSAPVVESSAPVVGSSAPVVGLSAQVVGSAAPVVGSACSFERIYFSRGNDRDIYRERKRLGEQLTPAILQAVGGDVEHTVCSFIPNTAEVAFYGIVEGFRRLGHDVRSEKVAWKDIKLRTFISDGAERNDLAAHVYDITYGSLEPGVDNLVIIDDSIVRGTTLRESIFKILDRLHPRKIVMVSSSPQIRYPDFYGIDMARLEELCAFRAAMALIEERGMRRLTAEVYAKCKEEPLAANHVRRIYEPFTVDELNRKIVAMLRPEGMQTPVDLVFQSIEGLHQACPGHRGDWYFTGHYPTPGGVRLVNQAFVSFVENVINRQ